MTDTITELREALRLAANRIEWCAGILPSENARDNASDWTDEARAVLDRTKPEEAPNPRDELKAQIAKLQARLDAMPEPVVYRAYWGPKYPDALSCEKFHDDDHVIKWTVENGVPKVLGDFRRIE
jgi:hypothetical protein